MGQPFRIRHLLPTLRRACLQASAQSDLTNLWVRDLLSGSRTHVAVLSVR